MQTRTARFPIDREALDWRLTAELQAATGRPDCRLWSGSVMRVREVDGANWAGGSCVCEPEDMDHVWAILARARSQFDLVG